jgi:hypothetical protein
MVPFIPATDEANKQAKTRKIKITLRSRQFYAPKMIQSHHRVVLSASSKTPYLDICGMNHALYCDLYVLIQINRELRQIRPI